mmetsp:Transcript_51840/g.113611  ORF Transcript_51840/g.113611 Transcript_51840/m.113611 type:complete len:152 (+) Transcript_51840:72-527(+)
MPRGTVKRWNEEKGFGFITPEDGSPDIFCHVRDLLDGDGSIQEGDRVKYQEDHDDRAGKPRAAEVELDGSGGGGRGRRDSGGRGGGDDYDRGGGGGRDRYDDRRRDRSRSRGDRGRGGGDRYDRDDRYGGDRGGGRDRGRDYDDRGGRGRY